MEGALPLELLLAFYPHHIVAQVLLLVGCLGLWLMPLLPVEHRPGSFLPPAQQHARPPCGWGLGAGLSILVGVFLQKLNMVMIKSVLCCKISRLAVQLDCLLLEYLWRLEAGRYLSLGSLRGIFLSSHQSLGRFLATADGATMQQAYLSETAGVEFSVHEKQLQEEAEEEENKSDVTSPFSNTSPRIHRARCGGGKSS